ncbi:MAG: P-II family nitrogen regulator [Firmicutes bacterium]|nr:P-II family nitrogen regulator [Bacillota bacterium]
MESKREAKLDALIVIMDYGLNNILKDIFLKNNIPLLILTHGYGAAKSFIHEILGYGGTKKIISLSIQTKKMSHYLLQEINKKIDLSKPGTGIAFTIKLSSITSVLSNISQQAEENLRIGSEDMTIKSKEPYHLIVTIVNGGYFDQVMEVAKKAGATGGTAIHARGLGSKEGMKYLGITIQPEKDLVLIVAPSERKRAIMENILHEFGLNTPGHGICFSLPVDSVMGLGANLENIEELNDPR